MTGDLAHVYELWRRGSLCKTFRTLARPMALLTDGRVLIHDESGNLNTWQNWWTLTPDANGNYATGTWTQVASCRPTTVRCTSAPPYCRMAVTCVGAEISTVTTSTNMGAIYDPVANVDLGQSTQRIGLYR